MLLSPVGSWLRDMGLAETMKLMKYEDESTNYIDIGPVNKVINMLCCWLDDPEGEPFRRFVHQLLFLTLSEWESCPQLKRVGIRKESHALVP